MAKRLRLIPQHEWEEYIKCKNETKEEGESENLKLLNDPALPSDLKLSIYEQNNKRKILPKSLKSKSEATETVEQYIPKFELVAHETKQLQTELDKPPLYLHLTPDEVEKFIRAGNIVAKTKGDVNANYFLTKLKNNPDLVSWNQKGEISYSRGPFIPNSNITKILVALFRNITVQQEPVSLHRMMLVMKYLKIPPSLILNRSNMFLYNLIFHDEE